MTQRLLRASKKLRLTYLDRKLTDLQAHENLPLDMAWVQKLGHQIRGNAVTFEFPLLAPIGADLEDAALQKRGLPNQSHRHLQPRALFWQV